MEKDLAEGIKRVAQALNKHEVDYMFVGGVAISFYGKPRLSANLPKGVEYMTLTFGIKLLMTTSLSSLVEYLK